MKNLIQMALAACLFAWPAAAGPYVELSAGFPSSDPQSLFDEDDRTTFEIDLDTNSVFYGAIGWDYGLLRSDLELALRDADGVVLQTDPPSADAGSGSFDSTSLMANLYADVPIGLGGLKVFAGGGVGGVMFDGQASGSNQLDEADFDDAGYGYAYQLRAGLAYEILPRLNVTCGYRYWRSGEIDFDRFELDEVEVHSIDVGLRLTF